MPGLHDAVLALINERVAPGGAVLDLGSGTGALAARLLAAGYAVEATDRSAADFGADCPFRVADLDAADWAAAFSDRAWDCVVAVEVIEHLRSPTTFLEQMARLIRDGGEVILTTPNLDSVAARVKFAVRGHLRMFDEWGDPTHISPIFWDLLTRRYLPDAGLRLVVAEVVPPGSFTAGRPAYRRLLRILRPWLRRCPQRAGDCHLLMLTTTPDRAR